MAPRQPFSWAALTPWRDDRWEADPAFRRKASGMLALVALCMVGCCLVTCMFGTQFVAPFVVGQLVHVTSNGAGSPQNPTFPVLSLSPIPQGSAPPAYAVPNAPYRATPTLLPSPSVAPTPTLPPCPPTIPPPALSSGSVRVGISPSPLRANCPAMLYLDAPRQPNAPVDIALTFGRLGQSNCTITSTTVTTDAQGQAAISFTVPGDTCFRGSILTTGHITVGGDSSADATFPAEG